MGPRCLPIADHAHATHDPNAVCYPKDLIEIMADDQDRQPLLLQLENHVFDRLYNNWQDPARPNDWTLFLLMKEHEHGESVYLKCAEHSARPTIAPPSLKDMAKSKDFDCDVSKNAEEGIFPTSGHAHVHVDADKQQVVTALVNLNVNGLDRKTVTLTYPLTNYFGDADHPIIFWSSGKDTGSIDRDMNDPGKFKMMTLVPGGWPSWTHSGANDLNYYGIFSCRMI
jgi:hypothetical protein